MRAGMVLLQQDWSAEAIRKARAELDKAMKEAKSLSREGLGGVWSKTGGGAPYEAASTIILDFWHNIDLIQKAPEEKRTQLRQQIDGCIAQLDAAIATLGK